MAYLDTWYDEKNQSVSRLAVEFVGSACKYLGLDLSEKEREHTAIAVLHTLTTSALKACKENV